MAMKAEESAYAELQRNIEGLEGDVEAARSEVFAAVNAATALRHAMEHASAAPGRGSREQLAKLEVESGDLRVEAERAERERAARRGGDDPRARDAIERCASTARCANRSSPAPGPTVTRAPASCARANTSWPGSLARLKSLEELAAARAEYGDGARLVLAESARRRRADGVGRRLSSRSTPATSARSRPASATSCSTSSCRPTSTPRPGCGSPSPGRRPRRLPRGRGP